MVRHWSKGTLHPVYTLICLSLPYLWLISRLGLYMAFGSKGYGNSIAGLFQAGRRQRPIPFQYGQALLISKSKTLAVFLVNNIIFQVLNRKTGTYLK